VVIRQTVTGSLQTGAVRTYADRVFPARQRNTDSRRREHTVAQPRPALGRRPWFALLRRARSLRRFALAMRPERVARSSTFLTLVGSRGSWKAGPILLATDHLQRYRGVKGGPGRVLLRAAAVHGRGLDAPLSVVGIDAGGRVMWLGTLQPGGFIRVPGATWTLELLLGDDTPAVGEDIRLYAHPGGWQTRSLRHPDRQPR
jgi:hypothetical protein